MNTRLLSRSLLTLVPLAALTLAGCSSTPTPPPGQATSAVSYQPGVPGGVRVETRTVTANVSDTDAAARKVTLLTSDGEKTTVKCGPEVINFDQIREGDQLKVKLAEELVIYLADAGAPQQAGGASVVALAAPGAKPGGVAVDTIQVTAKVTAIDPLGRNATLQLPDGSIRRVAVRPDVDLTQRRVGEKVVLRYTEALAISVEKP